MLTLRLVTLTTGLLFGNLSFAQTNTLPPVPENSPYPPVYYTPMPSPRAPEPVTTATTPAPTVAAAVTPEADERLPFTFAADLGTTAVSETNATTVVLAPLLEAGILVHPVLALHGAWGFITAIDGEGATARVGNPSLSGTYRLQVQEWHLAISLGITAPLASYPLGPDGRLHAFAYNQTMGIWGMWNAWLWTPNRMAVPVGIRAQRAFPGADLRFEIAGAPIFGVRGDASGADSFVQMAAEAGLAVGEAWVLRARLQTVILPSDSVDRTQTAVGLRAVLKTRSGDYFGGLLVNIDQPYGIFGGFERWGVHLGKEIDL